ncbi:IS66 family insertion sequence element accessory protein TnpA [Paenibacillus rigui]|uniref:Transposase n=1 Tax=Paenibacillus rigui TaxID=554312 RepID=A0A229UP38_9BACL|nr:hypothetical protein [Paenibacillus rigui]OXM85148.1 hypothetical protein CF651_16205 [Paenibacillus rigui]
MTAKEQLRQQWAARVAEYRASGLTLKAWCAVHDCTVDQMKYWLYKSKQRASSTLSESAPATLEDVKDHKALQKLAPWSPSLPLICRNFKK